MTQFGVWMRMCMNVRLDFHTKMEKVRKNLAQKEGKIAATKLRSSDATHLI